MFGKSTSLNDTKTTSRIGGGFKQQQQQKLVVGAATPTFDQCDPNDIAPDGTMDFVANAHHPNANAGANSETESR